MSFVFFSEIEPAKRGRKTGDMKNGTKTLRFKADGRASVEDIDDTMVKAIDRINNLLENFMGINDSELGSLILKIVELFCFQILIFSTTNLGFITK